MDSDQVVRQQLLELLKGGHAHMSFSEAVKDFPLEFANVMVPNGTYTPWHILEHIRLAQWDILDFILNPDYVQPAWPEGYWPAPEALAERTQWEHTIQQFNHDLEVLWSIVADPETDLYAPLPHAPDYTIFREILVVSDHNAYHIGEFAILRQVMGSW